MTILNWQKARTVCTKGKYRVDAVPSLGKNELHAVIFERAEDGLYTIFDLFRHIDGAKATIAMARRYVAWENYLHA